MSIGTLAVSKNTKKYRTRKPQYSPYYKCIEDDYEAFERVYDTKYPFRHFMNTEEKREQIKNTRNNLKKNLQLQKSSLKKSRHVR